MLKKIKIRRLILLIFCVYAMTTLVRQEFMIRDLKKEKTVKTNELAQIEKDKGVIQDKITNKDNIENIEEIARDELNMVRPNEIIYKDVGELE